MNAINVLNARHAASVILGVRQIKIRSILQEIVFTYDANEYITQSIGSSRGYRSAKTKYPDDELRAKLFHYRKLLQASF